MQALNPLKAPQTLFVKPSSDRKYEEVSTQEFAKTHGFVWQEEISIDETIAPQVAEHIKSDSTLLEVNVYEFNRIAREISESQQKLGLVFMGENVGYGVIARQDIPKGTYITTYAGVCSNVTTIEHSNEYVTPCFANSGKYIVDAEKARNFGGFLQHLPLNKKDTLKNPPPPGSIFIDDYSIDEKEIDKKTVATANVIKQNICCQGKMLLLVRTMREINAGEILGWDYGKLYWRKLEKAPLLFTTNGKVLPLNYHFIGEIDLIFAPSPEDMGKFSKTSSKNIYIDSPKFSLIKKNLDYIDMFPVRLFNGQYLFITKKYFMTEYSRCPQKTYLKLHEPKLDYVTSDTMHILLLVSKPGTNEVNTIKLSDEDSKNFIKEFSGLSPNHSVSISGNDLSGEEYIITTEDFTAASEKWDGKSWLIFDQSNPIIDEPQKTQQKTLSNAGSSTYFKPKDSARIHRILLAQIIGIIPPEKTRKFSGFRTAFNEKNYPKALRNVCTITDPEALTLVEALMKYKDELDFKINEQPGDAKHSALHHASGKGIAGKCNKAVYEYLMITQDADDTLLDDAGKTPRDYFEWAQQQPDAIIPS